MLNIAGWFMNIYHLHDNKAGVINRFVVALVMLFVLINKGSRVNVYSMEKIYECHEITIYCESFHEQSWLRGK